MKIEKASEEYNNILKELNEKPLYEDERTLKIKLNDLEKEILAVKNQMDFYKKKIDSVKNKIEFKMNIEKAISLENILKQEAQKNKELKQEYDSLIKLNNKQTKKIATLDAENRYKEKIEVLKSEIKNIKEAIKDANERYLKQERFLKLMHEKIAYIENQAKKLSTHKLETVKHFSQEDLKDVLESINSIRQEINNNCEQMKASQKNNDEKITSLKKTCMNIDKEFSDQEKVNKILTFKRNELKRYVKLLTEKNQKITRGDYQNIQKILSVFTTQSSKQDDLSQTQENNKENNE